jgi:hypothetical protein
MGESQVVHEFPPNVFKPSWSGRARSARNMRLFCETIVVLSSQIDMSFVNEQMLVTLFVSGLGTERSPWGAVHVATEFYYQRGRTDIVAYMADESVIAIEAKLEDWRTALHQAFRNRCFAHRSYVLLPKQTAMRAHRYAGEFDRRQVGICYLDNAEIVVLHPAAECNPPEPWLSARARKHIEAAGAGT